jgi:hypothetical protein
MQIDPDGAITNFMLHFAHFIKKLNRGFKTSVGTYTTIASRVTAQERTYHLNVHSRTNTDSTRAS